MPFRSVAAKFQLIDESGYQSVFVRFRDSPTLLGRLEKDGPERWLMRKLQRYTVNIPQTLHKKLLAQGDIREAFPGLFVQISDLLYHPQLGLMVEEEVYDPASLAL